MAHIGTPTIGKIRLELGKAGALLSLLPRLVTRLSHDMNAFFSSLDFQFSFTEEELIEQLNHGRD